MGSLSDFLKQEEREDYNETIRNIDCTGLRPVISFDKGGGGLLLTESDLEMAKIMLLEMQFTLAENFPAGEKLALKLWIANLQSIVADYYVNKSND